MSPCVRTLPATSELPHVPLPPLSARYSNAYPTYVKLLTPRKYALSQSYVPAQAPFASPAVQRKSLRPRFAVGANGAAGVPRKVTTEDPLNAPRMPAGNVPPPGRAPPPLERKRPGE